MDVDRGEEMTEGVREYWQCEEVEEVEEVEVEVEIHMNGGG